MATLLHVAVYYVICVLSYATVYTALQSCLCVNSPSATALCTNYLSPTLYPCTQCASPPKASLVIWMRDFPLFVCDGHSIYRSVPSHSKVLYAQKFTLASLANNALHSFSPYYRVTFKNIFLSFEQSVQSPVQESAQPSRPSPTPDSNLHRHKKYIV